MRKLIAVLVGLVLLFGGLLVSSAQIPQVTVGCILIGPQNDGGWSQKHFEGCTSIAAAVGDNVQVVPPVESILDDQFEATARELIRNEGIDILFAASATYQPFINDLALEFPDVKFEFTDPQVVEPKPNVRGFYVRYYVGNYICGYGVGRMLALDQKRGRVLDEASVGVVSSFMFPLTVRNINAWVQGVRDGIGFDIPAKVLWLGDFSANPWFNPPAAAALANALVDGGAVALNTYLDDAGIIEVAQQRSADGDYPIYATGITVDLRSHGPDVNVCNAIVDWKDYYAGQVRKLLDGTWEPGFTWAPLLSVPLIEIGPLGEFVPASVRRELLELQYDIVTGKFTVLSQFTEEELLNSVEFLPGIEAGQ